MRYRIPRLLRAAISVLCLIAAMLMATIATGAVTTTVVDIPSGGVTQRFLYLVPDAPIANIVVVPGGDGILGIQNDGTMTTFVASCSPFVRTRQALADRGFAVALVDANSAGSVYGFNDLQEVVRYMQGRHNVPTWVTGGSSSTAAIANLAVNLPKESSVGVIFFSPDRPSSIVRLIKRPTLLVYHSADPFQFGGLMFNALTAAPIRERVVFTGGNDGGCGYHLFNGLDTEFVAATTSFIGKYNASTTTQTQTFVGQMSGSWWDPARSGEGQLINFESTGNRNVVFFAYFTYNANGQASWLVGNVDYQPGATSISIPLVTGTGARFGAAFRSTDAAFPSSGTVVLDYVSCSQIRMRYTGSESLTLNLSRLVGPLIGAACSN